ncbi:MAG TPA: DNA polymerase III subunit delta' [Syntrophorhabdales bacterium]|nr:DNA polymerase III subunit delta' [Syntrophorhabdales bacterium]
MEFKGIVGHERPKGLLSSIFEKNRFPHALLFSGPLGVGKYTMAVEIVKYLFCEKGTGCGSCRACQNVLRNTHPDLRILRAETTIGIDELRGIRKEVYEPPYEAPLRTVIIDGAEQMTREAANAVLKTLEEPPPSNLFLLITSSEKDLPLTIRSRCMHIGFGPIPAEEMKAHLVKTLNLSEAHADLMASLSWGSMSSAFFWMDEENFAIRRRLAELVIGKKKGFMAASGLSEIMVGYENEARLFLYFLLSLFRDLWVINQVHNGETFTHDSINHLVNRDLKDLVVAGSWDETWIERSLQKIQETLEGLRYNINRWLAFESLALSITG